MSCWRNLTDLKVFITATNPSFASFMAMTSDTWDLVDLSILRLKHKLSSTAISATKPTLTANNVTHSWIETVAFRKNEPL